MGFQDFWRGGRERSDRDREREEMRSAEESRDFGRPIRRGDEQGFNRRGWREGSDYYGNDPERYADRGHGSPRWEGDEFAGRERFQSADDDWRDRSNGYRGEFDESRRRAALNDRWQNAYGPGISSFGRSRFESGDDDYALQGRERNETQRWSEDRSHWPRNEGVSAGGPFRGRGPRGYKRSDERIREDACECLTDDDRIDATNVEVTVEEGEVTLKGTVTSREEKRRAEDLIEQLQGVKDVHNGLRVASAAQARAEMPQQSSAQQATETERTPRGGARH